mmetsp:Transcript_58217/g.138637  ORF Transcript_58217/g.138637 Transcript_58217/m.138637 type:complete len:89 (-) Transcript_58217:269-535(-)
MIATSSHKHWQAPSLMCYSLHGKVVNGAGTSCLNLLGIGASCWPTHEGHEISAAHERHKDFWHADTVLSLVCLQYAADCSPSGRQGGV